MKKLVTTGIALVMALMLPFSAYAMEVPTGTVIQNLNGVQQYIKTYTVSAGTDPQELIEEPFDYEGFTYRYASITKAENEFDDEKQQTETVTVETDKKDLSVVLDALPVSVEYDDGQYVGTLYLDHSTIETVASGHTTKSYTVSTTNAAFVGYDAAGKAQYAALRGTYGDFKGEVPGSDKHYAFSIHGSADGQTVHLFEAAIDAMSYATLLKMTGREWQKDTLLSLGGVYKSRDAPTAPMALEQYLKDNPSTRNILLHLDNDEVGRSAAQSIADLMGSKYRVVDAPAPSGKDVNAYLMERIEHNRRKEEQERC